MKIPFYALHFKRSRISDLGAIFDDKDSYLDELGGAAGGAEGRE